MLEQTISKNALMTYLYDIGVLELAREQVTDEIQKGKMILENNEQIGKNLTPPNPPRYIEASATESVKDFVFVWCASIVSGLIIGALIGIFLPFRLDEMVVLFGAIGCIAGIFFGWNLGPRGNRQEVERANEAEKARYDEAMWEYEETRRAYEELEQYEHPKIRENILKCTAKEKELSDELLQQYHLGILHPQYQNKEAVLVMHNFLITGRCDTLKEALNAYEDFVWKKQDAQWKASVSRQLNDICSNQSQLLRSVDTLNTQMANVAELTQRGFKQIEASNEELRMQSQIIAGHTRSIALLQSIEFWDRHV